MAINVKWAVGTKLRDKACAWLNATSELALISGTSAKNDQIAAAPGLSLPYRGEVHWAQGRVTAGMTWGCSPATTQMFSCIGRYLQTWLSREAKLGKIGATEEATKAELIFTKVNKFRQGFRGKVCL